MTQPVDFADVFGRSPVMVILRGHSVQRSLDLAHQAWDLGIGAVEIPIQSDESLEALSRVVAAGSARGRLVGAGTVVSTDQVRMARETGAAYIVSPGLDEEVVHAAHASGLAALPGVATPTEVQRATRLGLTWLKAFPARTLGPAWFRILAGPFPDVRLVATGGIDAWNAPEFLDAGASVVAVGSALEDASQLDALAGLSGGGSIGRERESGTD